MKIENNELIKEINEMKARELMRCQEANETDNQMRINDLEAKIEDLQGNVIQPVKDLLVPLQCLVQFIVGHVAHELPQHEAKYQ